MPISDKPETALPCLAFSFGFSQNIARKTFKVKSGNVMEMLPSSYSRKIPSAEMQREFDCYTASIKKRFFSRIASRPAEPVLRDIQSPG